MITFDKALQIASDVFKDRVDKIGRPYMLHVMEVTCEVERHFLENQEYTLEQARVVALLHDVFEDSHLVIERVIVDHDFRDRIVNQALKAITRNKGELYFEYIERVKENVLAAFVKKHDLDCNIFNLYFLHKIDTVTASSLYRRYNRALYLLRT